MKRVNAEISLGLHDKFECKLIAVKGRLKKEQRHKLY